MSGVSAWSSFWGHYGPQRPALIHGDRTVAWGELEHGCGELAAGLRTAGVQKGDRVGGLMRNAPEHFEVVLACARIGAIFVPLNPMLTGPELAALAEDAELSVLVTDSAFTDVVGQLAHVVAPERCFFVDTPPDGGRPLTDLRGQGAVTSDDEIDMSDPLFICYTSGTTGRSKGAVLTHGNCEGLAVSVIAADGLRPEDRALVTVPLAFTGAGVSFAMPILHCGGSMLIRDSFDAAQVLADIERNGVTFIGVVPLILEGMMRVPDFERYDLSGLHVAKAGGASVPESLLRWYQDRGIGLVGAYGLTEGTGCNLELPAHDALRKLGSAGLPMLGQQARVIDATGADAAPGEPGELLLGGACVMQGYWRAPEATAAAIRDGWLHTGDVATVDDEGYFKIVDRQKDMIITGGINVYPAEVERALVAHPEVIELAVVGVPDEKWGETPVACVVSSRPDLTLEQLNGFVADSLAPFKRPRRLVLFDGALPRGMSGKVLKRELRSAIVDQQRTGTAA